MRLTINLDDDLYAMARSHAIATKTSISKAVGDLLRGRNASISPLPMATIGIHPLSGFPISKGTGRMLTEAEIRRSMDDDLFRPMELMGLTPEEIEEALK
jgi:hypothetical protein